MFSSPQDGIFDDSRPATPTPGMQKKKTQTMKTGISGSGGDGMSEFGMGNGKFILMISLNLKG